MLCKVYLSVTLSPTGPTHSLVLKCWVVAHRRKAGEMGTHAVSAHLHQSALTGSPLLMPEWWDNVPIKPNRFQLTPPPLDSVHPLPAVSASLSSSVQSGFPTTTALHGCPCLIQLVFISFFLIELLASVWHLWTLLSLRVFPDNLALLLLLPPLTVFLLMTQLKCLSTRQGYPSDCSISQLWDFTGNGNAICSEWNTVILTAQGPSPRMALPLGLCLPGAPAILLFLLHSRQSNHYHLHSKLFAS